MKKQTFLIAMFLSGAASVCAQTTQTKATLIGWNDLGMHCVDGVDYSIFSILPPYNNVHSQLVVNGKLVNSTTANNYKVSYQALSYGGSINTTSIGKTNFWTYVSALFNLGLAPDMGLAGNAMPGPGNIAKPFTFNGAYSWYGAEGIPITPYDDNNPPRKNFYPMMRLIARDLSGNQLAKADVVLPVSDEMTCTACHASGSNNPYAMPAEGWVNDPDPLKDYKKNILRKHDEKYPPANYAAVFSSAAYSAAGLYDSAVNKGKPVLCARCHASNVLPGTGVAGVPPLTQSLHANHANVLDPDTGFTQTLNASTNRSSCYRCHPGAVTQCLRGVMGNYTTSTGAQVIQCQNCHGSMSAVGSVARSGWLSEPTCQSCHTGTAVANSGQIVYTSALTSTGALRTAADLTFATNANKPVAGASLYRYSSGHGGLQCEACHGSTHAEYPSSHGADNVQSIALQGYTGTVAECSACHASTPSTVTGGPHGLHPLGQYWVVQHHDIVKSTGSAQCQKCHGATYRGAILSRTKTNRTFSVDDGRTVTLPQGTQVGCYNCHNGPTGG